jgi:hypothetical protein
MFRVTLVLHNINYIVVSLLSTPYFLYAYRAGRVYLCPFARMLVWIREPPCGFSWRSILVTSSITCRDIAIFAWIRHVQHWLYLETYMLLYSYLDKYLPTIKLFRTNCIEKNKTHIVYSTFLPTSCGVPDEWTKGILLIKFYIITHRFRNTVEIKEKTQNRRSLVTLDS